MMGVSDESEGLPEAIVRAVMTFFTQQRKKLERYQSFLKNFGCQLLYIKDQCCHRCFSQVQFT